jgi:AAA domain, putative AbiEii toxin, Type IV TA system
MPLPFISFRFEYDRRMRALNTHPYRPEYFLSTAARNYDARIQEYLSNQEFSRPPEHELRSDEYANILSALQSWTFNKCAYCESSEASQIDHFRPLSGADRGRGRVARVHYCWLATEWRNYFPVCAACSAIKRSLFPIAGTSPVGASLDTLRQEEKAQLLDPCYDDLYRHLLISPNGELYAKTKAGCSTIDVLRLNRQELVMVRQELLAFFIAQWNQGDLQTDFVSAEAPYSGAVRLFIYGLLGKSAHRHRDKIGQPSRLNDLQRSIGIIRAEGMHEQTVRLARASEPIAFPERYRAPAIRSLRVRNFKGIHNAELEFPAPNDGKQGQWIALVGANGIGKTSLLQALAIGLAGPLEANTFVESARDVLSTDAVEGEIQLKFWHEDESNVVKFNRDSQQFHGSYGVAPPLLGYGAYRILARRTLNKKQTRKDLRAHTLFDEHEKINGPHGWFDKLHGQRLDDAADTIQQLMLAPGALVDVVNKSIVLSINGKPQPLNALSSGLQNVFALATDILDAMYKMRDSVLTAPAVILIDELDAHLHPAWRMRIVERLRAAFPAAHFIYTTHDPLTLRGVDGQNILILKESEPNVIAIAPPVPQIEGLLIDQLLTSDLFSLNSTMNEALDGKFVRYYDLLAKPQDTLAEHERAELDVLAENLNNQGAIGDTERERIMYRVIDRVLAASRDNPTFSEWSTETIDMIEATLNNNSEYQALLND